MTDLWAPATSVWPCRSWLPFAHVLWYGRALRGGSGPFNGWAWRVRWFLNGRPNPGVPEGVNWSRSQAGAMRGAGEAIAATVKMRDLAERLTKEASAALESGSPERIVDLTWEP